jgi:hypothetical protein
MTPANSSVMVRTTNGSHQSDQGDFFSGLVENRMSKIISLLFAEFGAVTCCCISYSIIWYEMFGSDHKRTLINRLTVYIWCCPLFWKIFVQQVDVLRYIFGPAPKFICHFNYFLKLYLSFQAILLLDVIVVARYVFIFCLKNPAGFNVEFWSVYFLLWTFFLSAILQLVQCLLPGKEFPDIWICSGKNPNLDFNQKYQSLAPDTSIMAFSLLIHVVISIRIKIYKLKTNAAEVTQNPRSKIFWIFSLETDSVLDVAESIVPFGLVLLAMLVNLVRRRLELDLLNQYPDCLWEYFYTHIRPSLTIFLLFAIKLIRDHQYRSCLSRELKSLFNN